MRLWHKDLIPYLPKNQLVGQWRECCAIARNIKENGKPGTILVNKIMEYPQEHFWAYAMEVRDEMIRRGFKCDISKFGRYLPNGWLKKGNEIPHRFLFYGWHDIRYLRQCFYNLQEKSDCGGMSAKEWSEIDRGIWEAVQ